MAADPRRRTVVLAEDMTGTAITHTVHAQWPILGANVVLGGLAATLARMRRPAWADALFRRGAATT